MLQVALFGAAGKMGTRIAEKLGDDPELEMVYVEASAKGEALLRQRGLTPTPSDKAASTADIIILAVPDTVIGPLAKEIVPLFKSGAMLICLDPAAPFAGVLPARKDVSYFVTHPCHPPIVNEEESPEARDDFFGGIAKQSIVCALLQGPETDYAKGEKICRKMFAPILCVHRVTVEQMALLEPAMAETVTLTCMTIIREALDEVIARGVPQAAAWDFLLGHMKVNVGILFGFIDAQVSDGARLAVERAKRNLLQPDWKKVFEPDNVMKEVQAIIHGIQEE